MRGEGRSEEGNASPLPPCLLVFLSPHFLCNQNSEHAGIKCIIHMHHSLTYLSREHMNPKLTCSQRQWLHRSVGTASHRYREVMASSPVEVLNFFQASLRNCKNCDHNCEDHSSFDKIQKSAIERWNPQ